MGSATKRRGSVRGPLPGRRPNNTGTVFWRPDRERWVAEVSVGDKTRSRSARTREEAERHLAVLLRGVEESALATTDRQTLGQFLAGWLTGRKARGDIRPRTHRTYISYLRHVVREIGMIELSDLRPVHVQQLYDELAGRLSARTLSSLHATLKAALADAVDLDLLATNPAAKAKVKRPGTRSRAAHLDLEDSRALLTASRGTRWHALWTVCATMGFRIGEALALRWNDVDWDDRTIAVDETLTMAWDGSPTVGPPKTESSRRIVVMSDAAHQALGAHRTIIGKEGWSWGPDDWIFPSEKGVRMHRSVAARRLERDAAHAGLGRITPHVLRHTAATLLLEAGTPLHVAKEILGHSSIQVTVDIYGHVDRAMTVAAMRRLDETFAKKASSE